MKILYKSLLILLISISAKAQRLPGFDSGKITVNGADLTIVASVVTSPKEVATQIDKQYFWYSAGQIRSTQGGYSGKLLNGGYISYYLTKNLKEKGYFKHGLRDGEWTSWFENGNIQEKTTWKEGRKHGRFCEFSPMGKPIREGEFKKGKLDGKVLFYGGTDSVQTSYYNNGDIYKRKHGPTKAGKFLSQIEANVKKGPKLLKKRKSKSKGN